MGTYVPVQSYQAAPQPVYQQQPQQQQPVVYQQQQPVYQQQQPVYQQQQSSPFAQPAAAPATNYGNQMTTSYGNSYSVSPQFGNNYSAPVSNYSYSPTTTNNYQGPVVNGPVIVNNSVNVFNNTNNYYAQPQAVQQQPAVAQQQQSPFVLPQQASAVPAQAQSLTPQQQGALLTTMGGLMTAMGGLLTLAGSLFGQQQPGAAQPTATQPAQPAQPVQPAQPPQPDANPMATPASAKPEDTVRKAFRTFLGHDPSEDQIKKYSKKLQNQSLTERQLGEMLLTSNSYKKNHSKGKKMKKLNINKYADDASAQMYAYVLGRKPTAQEAKDMKKGIVASYKAGRPLRVAVGLQMDFLYATPEHNKKDNTGNTGTATQAA